MNLVHPQAEASIVNNIAKPLRIAVLLGDASNLDPDSAVKLRQLDKVQLCSSAAEQATTQQRILHKPLSLTALLSQAVAAIEQGKLVELKFTEANHSVMTTQPLTQSLYLLDGLSAAKLRLHAHAFIAGFATGNDALSVTDAALTTAKRNPAQTFQHQVFANTLNEAFVALHHGVTALAARTKVPLQHNIGPTHQTGYWFSGQHQARVLCLNLTPKSLATEELTTPPNQADACLDISQDVNPTDVNPTDVNQSLVLTQGTQLLTPKTLVDENRLFVPIGGDSIDELKAKLLQLLSSLGADSLNIGVQSVSTTDSSFASHQLAVWFKNYDANAPLALVLMAASLDDLKLEANAMVTALENDAVRYHGQHFKTPAGSCFTAKPLGDKGLTFVYPGVGTVYANMFNNLHEYFPALYQQLEREGDLSAMLQSPQIYAVDSKTAANMNLSQQAISGVGASYLFTKLLTQVFNIQPKIALGYSMGEAAMWASLDVWQTPHALINATENSDIFNHTISGELTAVRQAWRLESNESIVWNSFVVRSGSNEINALLPEFPRAYLAITQGDTCVIAGCETSCKALLTKLGKRGIAANRVTAMHTAPAMLVHGQVQTFYTQALKADAQDSPIHFISAAQTAPVTIDSHSIGRAIADTFCSPLDFSALIQNACEQGAKLFVEVGADRQTSTLIDKINHAHAGQNSGLHQSCANAVTAAIACNAKGADAITSLLKCLAQLISHRVPLSLAPLLPDLSTIDTHLSSAVLPQGEPL